MLPYINFCFLNLFLPCLDYLIHVYNNNFFLYNKNLLFINYIKKGTSFIHLF